MGTIDRKRVGSHLLNCLQGRPWSVTYWRDSGEEVDYVVSHGAQTWAVEVKSGRGDRVVGLAAFRKPYPRAKTWLIGESGMPLTEFFGRPARVWFG